MKTPMTRVLSLYIVNRSRFIALISSSRDLQNTRAGQELGRSRASRTCQRGKKTDGGLENLLTGT